MAQRTALLWVISLTIKALIEARKHMIGMSDFCGLETPSPCGPGDPRRLRVFDVERVEVHVARALRGFHRFPAT